MCCHISSDVITVPKGSDLSPEIVLQNDGIVHNAERERPKNRANSDLDTST